MHITACCHPPTEGDSTHATSAHNATMPFIFTVLRLSMVIMPPVYRRQGLATGATNDSKGAASRIKGKPY